jgi:hypothetical protein
MLCHSGRMYVVASNRLTINTFRQYFIENYEL